jgi:hypothetical protein
VFTRPYDEARREADRALAIAERLGYGDQACRLFRLKGMLAQFEGRMWEAITLVEGARRLADQLGLQDEVDSASSTLTNVLALDDPRASVEIGRRIIDQARRTGHRNRETINLGNTAEDLRRTGDWDWVVGELDRAIRDEDRNVTDLFLDQVRATYLALRGVLAPSDFDALKARIADLGDADMDASLHDLLGYLAVADGRFVDASREWITFADGSDLNAPYALPRAGEMAVLGGDAALAKQILDRLGALGSRGRAIETDISVIRAGVLALDGNVESAMAGYRLAWSRYTDLGLVYDRGLLALVAASTIGPADPEVAGWLGEAREIFDKLRAAPLLKQVDAFTASFWSGRGEASRSVVEDASEAERPV